MIESHPSGSPLSDISKVPDLHKFSHEAMATTFEIFIVSKDFSLAQQASFSAFDLLDRLESRLSRFLENSEIFQINLLQPEQSLVVGPEVFECLRLSSELFTQTEGAFDVTIGLLVDLSLDEKLQSEIIQKTGMDLIELDPQKHTVKILSSAVNVDLGGIGKGFALDKMAALLSDWDITTALLSCSSTVLALGFPESLDGWPLTFTNPATGKIFACLNLKNGSISSSGIQKSEHIIDPRTGLAVTDRIAAWSYADSAANADALSTAFMIMPQVKIKSFCRKFPGTSALIIEQTRGKRRYGYKILRFPGIFQSLKLL